MARLLPNENRGDNTTSVEFLEKMFLSFRFCISNRFFRNFPWGSGQFPKKSSKINQKVILTKFLFYISTPHVIPVILICISLVYLKIWFFYQICKKIVFSQKIPGKLLKNLNPMQAKKYEKCFVFIKTQQGTNTTQNWRWKAQLRFCHESVELFGLSFPPLGKMTS